MAVARELVGEVLGWRDRSVEDPTQRVDMVQCKGDNTLSGMNLREEQVIRG